MTANYREIYIPKNEGDWFWIYESLDMDFIEVQIKGKMVRIFKEGIVVIDPDDEDQTDFNDDGTVNFKAWNAREAPE